MKARLAGLIELFLRAFPGPSGPVGATQRRRRARQARKRQTRRAGLASWLPKWL